MKKFISKVGEKLVDKVAAVVAGAILAIILGILAITWKIARTNLEPVLVAAVVILVVLNVAWIIFVQRLRRTHDQPGGSCKKANVWWLCSDVLHARGYINDPKMKLVVMVDNLERIHHHAIQLGLDNGATKRIWELRNEAIDSIRAGWSPAKRASVGQELERYFNDTAQEIQRNQKDFEPDPPDQYKP